MMAANFDEALIDVQLEKRRRRRDPYAGVHAPQYGRGEPPPDNDQEPDDEPEEAA